MTPPAPVCLLRLSAIGDACHVVPLLRTLQRAWPQTRFTWLIGRAEARLMLPLLPEVEFITVDKRAGLAGLRALRLRLTDRRFDLLLHLQLSLRASAVALLAIVAAPQWDRALLASGVYLYAPFVPKGLDLETQLKAGTLLYSKDGAPATVSVKRLKKMWEGLSR